MKPHLTVIPLGGSYEHGEPYTLSVHDASGKPYKKGTFAEITVDDIYEANGITDTPEALATKAIADYPDIPPGLRALLEKIKLQGAISIPAIPGAKPLPTFRGKVDVEYGFPSSHPPDIPEWALPNGFDPELDLPAPDTV